MAVRGDPTTKGMTTIARLCAVARGGGGGDGRLRTQGVGHRLQP